MNSLSWFIYWADVVNAIDNVFIFVGVAGVVSIFIGVVAVVFGYSDDRGVSADERLEARRHGKAFLRWGGVTFLVSCLVVAFLPSKDTVYAIAASEAGEEIMKSPEATKARAALQAWIDKQTETLQPEKK